MELLSHHCNACTYMTSCVVHMPYVTLERKSFCHASKYSIHHLKPAELHSKNPSLPNFFATFLSKHKMAFRVTKRQLVLLLTLGHEKDFLLAAATSCVRLLASELIYDVKTQRRLILRAVKIF